MNLAIVLLGVALATPAPVQTHPALVDERVAPTSLRPVTPSLAAGSGELRPAIHAALRRTVKIYGASIATEHGYGSGIIVSSDGQVVTVLSLLLEGANLRVVTHDGHVYPAQVTYRDSYRDLAVLKMANRPDNLNTDAPIREQMVAPLLDAFTLRDSQSVRPGNWVLALGNVFKVAEGDEPVSVMKGVVSARTRMDAARGVQPFPYRGDILVLDAITSGPGSPGSAVIDVSGNLVGIVGKSVTSQLTNTLLNYAFPVEEIKALLSDAGSGQRTTSGPAEMTGPGYHGIQLSRIAYRTELPFVTSVARDSPAAGAGIRKDDLILSANGVAIPRGRAFNELCERLHPGDELSLIIKRGEQLIPVRLKLTDPAAARVIKPDAAPQEPK